MRGFGDSTVKGWVFKLILINVVFFTIQIFSDTSFVIYSIGQFKSKASIMTFYLGLIPAMVTERGFIWQFFSYMFLHSTDGFFHIFFNMYALLIFGIPIEQTWGSRRFLLYYMFCGVGAGITIFLINIISGGVGYYIPTIGASGAVFGLLLAFGILYPNAELLLFFFLPIKAKYLVIMYGSLELFLEIFGGPSSISHAGHLGGLLFGIIFFLIFQRKKLSFKGKILKAKLQKDFKEYDMAIESKKKEADTGNRDRKIKILKILKEEGYDNLSDDDIQFIKFLEIMTEDEDFQCHRDYNAESGYCQDCTDYDICFLREIKKYLKK